MALIIFRALPGVSTVEDQLEMRSRDRLLDDELEELPHLIDETSLQLFGITQRDTFYWALPAPVRGEYSRGAWERQFDVLGEYTRDPNAPWAALNLDVRCQDGGRLHCFEVFGRQLVCALREMHPLAVMTFAGRDTCWAA
jgi:hypothetical protein